MILSRIRNAFFPPRCVCCDGITENDFPVCKKCLGNVLHPYPKKSRCSICFMKHDACICAKRQFFEKLSVSLPYEGTARRTIHKLKFRSRPDLIENYARLLLYSLNERDMLMDTDYITYIPMSAFAKFRRGYNQSHLLAKKLSVLTGIPVKGFLVKYKATKTQHSLDSYSRSGNLLGMFEPDKKYLDELEGKTVVIIDDVMTTGNTLNETAKTLLIFGAGKVYAACCTVKKTKKPLNTEK
ncbi:MAG: ComF family protein [Ruminococcaceae bacterium]|nr:ComF family protein [Oscillospiraceae bacterium]